MRRQPSRTDTVSALLLQESVVDARIWSPLKDSLQNDLKVIEASPPVSPVILSGEHWAVYLTDWIAAQPELGSVNAVVGHGHAAFAALLVADRGMVGDSVIIIDPEISSIVQPLSDSVQARMYTVFQSEEVQTKLAAMFEALDPEDLQALRRTGRLSEEGTERFTEAILAPAEIDHPELRSLAKDVVTERLSRAFSEGVQLQPPKLGIDFPGIASRLGSKLHIALTADSVIERLELRAELQEAHPQAEFHTLRGPTGPRGWWESPETYANLVRSALPKSAQ